MKLVWSACSLALLAPAAAQGNGPVAMHRIELGECGEARLDGRLAAAAAARSMKFEMGSCAEQGYTVPGETTTLELPGVAARQGRMAAAACDRGLDAHAQAAKKLASLMGVEAVVDGWAEEYRKLCDGQAQSKIVLTRFKKPDLFNIVQSLAPMAAPLAVQGGALAAKLPSFLGQAAGQSQPAEAGPCCSACEAPREKYYSVDMRHGHCGECCMEPWNYHMFKIFEPNLTKADGKTCASLGFPEYATTVTHGVFPISMKLDEYNPAPQLPQGMKSGYKLGDGLCGEVAIDEKYFGYVAKLAGLTEGFCKDAQYSEDDGTKTMDVPVLGQIIVHLYKKAGELDLVSALNLAKAIVLDEKLTLYRVAPGRCLQAVIKPELEAAVHTPMSLLGFALGSCPQHGYAQAAGSKSMELPGAGSVEVALFEQSAGEELIV